jgi:CheY-like chemotaxis protein
MALILIAEASKAVRQLLEHTVAHLGHQPITPSDTSDDPNCDLLLLDPTWPRGRRLAERLRSRNPTLPIIFIGSTKQPPLADSLAVHTRVPKPFALQDLERAIAAALLPTHAETGQ